MDLIEEKVRRIENILIQLQNEIVKIFNNLAQNGQTDVIPQKCKSIEEFLNQVLVKIVDGDFNHASDGLDGEHSTIFESDDLHDFDPGDLVDDGPDLDLICPIKIEDYKSQNASPIVVIEQPKSSIIPRSIRTRSKSKKIEKSQNKLRKKVKNRPLKVTNLQLTSNLVNPVDLYAECQKREVAIVLEKLPENFNYLDVIKKDRRIRKRRKIAPKTNEMYEYEAQNSPIDINDNDDNDNDTDYELESSDEESDNNDKDEDYEMSPEKPPKNKRFICTQCKRKRRFNTEFGLKYHTQRFHSPTSILKLTCNLDKCNQTFNSQKSYLEHRNQNHSFCKICCEKFESRYLCLVHMEKQHLKNENLWFSCSHCPKKFLYLEGLRSHNYKVHNGQIISFKNLGKNVKNGIQKPTKRTKGNLKCDQEDCTEEFTCKIDYLKHQNAIHFVTIYPCTECPDIFAQIGARNVHTRECHPDCKLICDFEGCSQEFLTNKKDAYDLHRFSHQIPDFDSFWEQKICPFCRKNYGGKKNGYRRHIMEHHPDYNVPSKPQFNCQYCDKSFKSRTNCVNHEKGHFESYHCSEPQCQMSYNSKISLYSHNRKIHGTFSCTYQDCSKRFITLKSLDKHLKEHEELYLCHLCTAKPFKFKEYLDNHMRTCHKEYPCEFEGCSRIFYYIGHLKEHEAEHDSAKIPEFLCTTCGEAFWSKRQLTHHTLDKHDERYKCEDCGKFCRSKLRLEKHQLTHTKDRDMQEALKNSTGPKFQCDECDRIYTQAQSLNYHMRNFHFNKGDIVCTYEDCGKSFKNERALDIHRDSHLGISGYSCKFCDKTLSSKYNLQRHTSDYHRKERNYPFKCSAPDCGQSFFRNKFLEDHIQKMHN